VGEVVQPTHDAVVPTSEPLPQVHALPANHVQTLTDSAGKDQTANTGFQALSAALPDSFVICTGYNCDGHCVYWTLDQLNLYTCYIAPFNYNSAEIIRNSGAGLSPGIASGGPGCSELWTLPYVNTCYYWNSPRSTFYRG
jgi:hypothetical protein